jgi:prepilin-type N-terminal cleavage/methylation domain-containing protein
MSQKLEFVYNGVMKISRKKGFSLVELMVGIVILGILAAVATASYRIYLSRSKMSEAYTNLDLLTKSQVSYFVQHKEFCFFGPKPRRVPNSKLPFQSEPGEVNDNIVMTEWGRLGNPIAFGSQLAFAYTGGAGKTKGNGEAIFRGISNPEGQNLNENSLSSGWTYAGGVLQDGENCTNSPISVESYVQTTGKPHYNWSILMAVGNLKLNSNNLCTQMVKILDTTSDGSVDTSKPVHVYSEGE